MRVLVVLGVIGLEGGIGKLDHDVTVEVGDAAFGILRVGLEIVLAARRRVDAGNLHAEIRTFDSRLI